jgi:hypothetical protein
MADTKQAKEKNIVSDLERGELRAGRNSTNVPKIGIIILTVLCSKQAERMAMQLASQNADPFAAVLPKDGGKCSWGEYHKVSENSRWELRQYKHLKALVVKTCPVVGACLFLLVTIISNRL